MEELQELTEDKRLEVYNLLTDGCTHFWSKGKRQDEYVKTNIERFAFLVTDDPFFLVHLAAWSCGYKNKNWDLRLLSIYLNALSDADGTPFVPGGTLRKPNFRSVSIKLLDQLFPNWLVRLRQLDSVKWNLKGTESSHFPLSLRRAMQRHVMGLNENRVLGYVKNRQTKSLKKLYRLLHLPHPAGHSPKVAQLLRWKDKLGRVEIKQYESPFKGLSDAEIAKKIEKDKLSFSQALSAVSQVTFESAKALLGVATPNEALINRALFDEAGLLADPETEKLYFSKIGRASVVDRIDRITTATSEVTKDKLAGVRTKTRRESFGFDGKIAVWIDISGSMKSALELAKECIAEIADFAGGDPKRFFWAVGNDQIYPIQEVPKSKEHAMQLLYPYRSSGSTDCLAYYRAMQSLDPVDIFVWITDGGHCSGSVRIEDLKPPKTAIIVPVPGNSNDSLSGILKQNGIEPIYLKPEALKQGALLGQAIQTAMRGRYAIIDEIMNWPLP